MKTLDVLSKQEHSEDSREIERTCKLMHDDDVTNKDIQWINGAWSDERVEAWALWKGHYLPALNKASQDETLRAFNRRKRGRRSVMDQIVQCLDDVFFGGQISPYCKFEWTDCDGNLGQTLYDHAAPTDIRIQVDLTLVENVMHLLGTILHELCHAHQFLFGCQTATLCQSACSDFQPQFPSRPGHPDCFFRLSYHVEDLASRLHRKRINLGRRSAFIRQYDDTRTIPEFDAIFAHFPYPKGFSALMRHFSGTFCNQPPFTTVTPVESRLDPPAVDDLQNAKLPLARSVKPTALGHAASMRELYLVLTIGVIIGLFAPAIIWRY
ncbi:unnamed protein product [Zymoseptoria tritici ST99CH_1E4]|uniref:Uncharacterized protein n=1 Tax=Zymoseptoria tritici ST99CH_1E4 TaxID=1276532 RepID=A0A2H1FIW8_ZYMTR|nr:unnamed protein product [Zymoseptoria tritici ST99CH_1E4]